MSAIENKTSDNGFCAKFGAFLVGAAGVGGLMAYAFSSPIVGGVSNAAGEAAANTMGKILQSPAVQDSLKTGGQMLGYGYTAKTANGISLDIFHDYRRECSWMFQDAGCAASAVGGIFFMAVAGACVYGMYKLISNRK